jgi:hypothetical protein
VLEHNVVDDKLRLRKLIPVFDNFSLRIGDSAWSRRLLRTNILLGVTLILRANGNRRAQDYQRGGEPLQQ